MLPLSRLHSSLAPYFAVVVSAFALCLANASFAGALKITSNPSGATVELDGVAVGTTPFARDFPGGFFHRTHTVLGSRLEHGLIARISLVGHSTQEIELSRGPLAWIDVHGHFRGEYWLFKSDHFHVQLEALDDTLTGSVATATALQPAALPPVLSLEEVVRRCTPAVVRLIESDHSGSGFLVTETGVIATNARVARGDSSLLVQLPNGTKLPAKVVYVDRNRDLGLVKVTPPRGFTFPRLPLADLSLVHQGEPVVAIGNPAESMNFSAVKGIVSAIGQVPAFGVGTWIQTDAPINLGNSAGPLLNTRGQVIGLNTLKVHVKGINNISYALSASDLLKVLRRFYPDLAPPPTVTTASHSSDVAPDSTEPASSGSAAASSSESSPAVSSTSLPATPSAPSGFGAVAITSEPDSAEICVDGKFHGNAPATLKLTAGSHTIVLKRAGFADYTRNVEVPAASKLTLKASLGKADGAR